MLTDGWRRNTTDADFENLCSHSILCGFNFPNFNIDFFKSQMLSLYCIMNLFKINIIYGLSDLMQFTICHPSPWWPNICEPSEFTYARAAYTKVPARPVPSSQQHHHCSQIKKQMQRLRFKPCQKAGAVHTMFTLQGLILLWQKQKTTILEKKKYNINQSQQ